MRRREFIAGLAGAATWPMVGWAQQPAMPVIGWLAPVPGTLERSLPAFRQGLAETGYVVGGNVTIESREGDGRPALVADLIRQHVTVLSVVGITGAQAAKAATQTIPVVFLVAVDPVETGVVASLNRPSGNLTGVAGFGDELAAKRLELLHKLVPAADPIAMLARRVGSELIQAETRAMQSAARVLGVRLLVLYASTESEVAAAFANLVEQHAGALVTSTNLFSVAAINQIISLASRYAVPTLFSNRAPVAAGALASYGTNTDENIRQMGVYTGRILKGEKPSSLPVMLPTKFEMVINHRTGAQARLVSRKNAHKVRGLRPPPQFGAVPCAHLSVHCQ
jgi:putative tryptophan/tyrosine transport system substrate-binding protein